MSACPHLRPLNPTLRSSFWMTLQRCGRRWGHVLTARSGIDWPRLCREYMSPTAEGAIGDARMRAPPSAGVDARRIANRAQRFQRAELFRPNLSPPLQTDRILLAPESTGRASGRRPSGFQGWSSGKRSSVVLSDNLRDGPGQVFPETWDETQAAKDRRTRQAWAEIAHAVRSKPMLRPSGASIGAG